MSANCVPNQAEKPFKGQERLKSNRSKIIKNKNHTYVVKLEQKTRRKASKEATGRSIKQTFLD